MDLLDGALLYPGVAGGGGGGVRVDRRDVGDRRGGRRRAVRHPDAVRHPLARRGPAAAATTAARSGRAATSATDAGQRAAGLTLAHPQLVLPFLFLLQVNLRVERLTGLRLLQHTHKPTVSTGPGQEAASSAAADRGREGVGEGGK